MSHPNAVKIIKADDVTLTVAGYGVVFGGKDLYGETFTKDTDFDLELVPTKPVLYDHRLSEVKHRLGNVISVRADEKGLWVEAQLTRHAEYMSEVEKLIEDGILGWSSGSVGHMVDVVEGRFIRSWPIVEFSLTPTPAEPRTLGVERLRSLAASDPIFEKFIPVEPTDAQEAPDQATGDVAEGATGKAADTITTIEPITEKPIMSDEIKGAPNPEMDALKTKVDGLTDALNRVLGHIEESPAIRKSGYFTEDGGDADPHVKSMGDFLLAVKRNDKKRLTNVYKAMSEEDGSAGGYTVPADYEARLMQVAGENALIRPRATVIPVSSNAGSIPALDQTTAPSAGVGQTALAGGVRAYWTSEAATITSTDPTFDLVDYKIHKMAGYTVDSNEHVADSVIGVETLLTTLFGRAVAAMEDYAFLRGDGVGKPLGILNAAAAISITVDSNGVFAYADAAEIASRFKPLGGSGVWLMHRSTLPDLTAFEVGTGGAVWVANVQAGLDMPLLGYPILWSEHLPQANNSGHAILADLSAYVVFDRQGIQIAFSEHANFTTDQATWRFTKRLDGKPWLNNAITLADPQGSYTCSPFVYSND